MKVYSWQWSDDKRQAPSIQALPNGHQAFEMVCAIDTNELCMGSNNRRIFDFQKENNYESKLGFYFWKIHFLYKNLEKLQDSKIGNFN